MSVFVGRVGGKIPRNQPDPYFLCLISEIKVTTGGSHLVVLAVKKKRNMIKMKGMSCDQD